MKNLKNNLIIAVGLFFLYSCANTLTVKNEDGKNLKGLPFYGYKGVIKQETQYLVTWDEYELKRSITLNGKKQTESVYKVVKKKDQDVGEITNALINLNAASSNHDYTDVVAKINALEKYDEKDESNRNDLSNTTSLITEIDYANPMRINSKVPWFGTASFSQKLNANGTLAEVTATVDSQLDELASTAAGLVSPFLDYKKFLIERDSTKVETSELKDKGRKPASAVPTINYYYSIELKRNGAVYTFTENHPISKDSKENEYLAPIEFNTAAAYFLRTPLSQIKSKKKEEEPTIKVSGNIVLPEK